MFFTARPQCTDQSAERSEDSGIVGRGCYLRIGWSGACIYTDVLASGKKELFVGAPLEEGGMEGEAACWAQGWTTSLGGASIFFSWVFELPGSACQ